MVQKKREQKASVYENMNMHYNVTVAPNNIKEVSFKRYWAAIVHFVSMLFGFSFVRT